MLTIEQIYQQHIKLVSFDEQLNLVSLITQTLTKQDANWRDSMSEKVKILVSEKELIQPMADIWEDYI